MESERVGHDWVTDMHTNTYAYLCVCTCISYNVQREKVQVQWLSNNLFISSRHFWSSKLKNMLSCLLSYLTPEVCHGIQWQAGMYSPKCSCHVECLFPKFPTKVYSYMNVLTHIYMYTINTYNPNFQFSIVFIQNSHDGWIMLIELIYSFQFLKWTLGTIHYNLMPLLISESFKKKLRNWTSK